MLTFRTIADLFEDYEAADSTFVYVPSMRKQRRGATAGALLGHASARLTSLRRKQRRATPRGDR